MQEDDYSYIMAEAIADRLAEAFAEVLHGITRKELWAYAPDEDLSAQDMLRVKYQGMPWRQARGRGVALKGVPGSALMPYGNSCTTSPSAIT